MMQFTIVSSSTRIGRVSHRIALALEKQINNVGHKATVIDLAALKLPRFSERYPRIQDKPDSWIKTMDSLKESDGIIFLTPEYNGSFSSGLKNFIDVFAKEGFRGKPIGVATGSVGYMGGASNLSITTSDPFLVCLPTTTNADGGRNAKKVQ